MNNCNNTDMKIRKHFTLVELLVVIAIIGILTAILLPALRTAKKVAHDVICKSNLKQIACAGLTYTSDSHGWLPVQGTTWSTTYNKYHDPHAYKKIHTSWYQKFETYGVYKRGSKKSSPMHCPEASRNVQPRWYYVDRGDRDYTANYFLTMKEDGSGNYLTMSHKQTGLNEKRFWFADADFWYSSATYPWYTGTFSSIGTGANMHMPWMLDIATPFYGKGHPGNTANFIFGDCHVEALSRPEVISRTSPGDGYSKGKNFNTFNGWYIHD